jgi:hypothetical protein
VCRLILASDGFAAQLGVTHKRELPGRQRRATSKQQAAEHLIAFNGALLRSLPSSKKLYHGLFYLQSYVYKQLIVQKLGRKVLTWT